MKNCLEMLNWICYEWPHYEAITDTIVRYKWPQIEAIMYILPLKAQYLK